MNNLAVHCDTDSDTQDGSAIRILIVEDNRAIATALKLVLQHEGYETKWCEDESVYKLIHDWHPALILMDLKMPHLDGSQVTFTIKEDPETKGIPVIVVTAENVTPEKLEAMHANELIRKPFPVRRLLERISYWLGDSHRMRIANA